MNTRLLWLGLASLCLRGVAVFPARADTNELAVVIQADGTVSLPDVAEVPAYGSTGKWTELPGKSSDRYLSRHFMFLIPDHAPALELYLVSDRSGEKPDGAFEMGLIGGYVNGFAGKAGFTADDPKFENCTVGATKFKRCKVKLTHDQRTLWVYGYIYVRQPSLTFLSVRPDPDAQAAIERYLATVRLH